MIRDYPYSLAPGEQVRPRITGNYVALKKSSKDQALVHVEALNDTSQTVANVELLQGQALPIPRSYTNLVITNNDAEAIEIVILAGVGDFQSYRMSGSVTLEGNIAGIDAPIAISELAGSRLAKLGEIEAIDYTGVSTWARTGQTVSTDTIVSPASNINGIEVIDGACYYGNKRFSFKTSTPTGWNDSAVTIIAACSDLGVQVSAKKMIIPPGYGLYAQSFDAGASYMHIDYKVL